jgi:hypothetical protein
MKPQPDVSVVPRALHRFGQPTCPHCREMVLAPMMSEYVEENLIRHLWSCDTCGHEFRTSVRPFGRASQKR